MDRRRLAVEGGVREIESFDGGRGRTGGERERMMERKSGRASSTLRGEIGIERWRGGRERGRERLGGGGV